MKITTAELQQFKLLQAAANELSSQFDRLNCNHSWAFQFQNLHHKISTSVRSQGQVIVALELSARGSKPEWIAFTGYAEKKEFIPSQCYLEKYVAEAILSICGHFVADLRHMPR